MEVLIVKFITLLILPPGIQILLMGTGLWLKQKFHRTGLTLFIFGFVSLILLSLPIVADFNLRLLQPEQALAAYEINSPSAGAIVVLGGGRIRNAPEYGTDIPKAATIQRLRYAAYLHKKTGLPILVSGGNVFTTTKTSEAALMRDVLKNDFNVETRWLEEDSKNTWQNAQFSREMLAVDNIDKVILVTQAFHMIRSEMAFNAVGLNAIPAATSFIPKKAEEPLLIRLLPKASALQHNAEFLHELIGIVWYKLRY